MKRQQKEQKKKKAEERKQKAFADYYDYAEEIKKIPPHRVLAINRGERARVLRVKLDCDIEANVSGRRETLRSAGASACRLPPRMRRGCSPGLFSPAWNAKFAAS